MALELNNTENPLSNTERLKINENWQRIISGYSHLQQQIKVLAGGAEVDELIQRLNDAIDNANVAVQKAIDANKTATQEAIEENNTALQTALDKVSKSLVDMNSAITNAKTATNEANVAKQGALDATKQAQDSINKMQAMIDNLRPRGVWDVETQYYTNNIVTFENNSYIALQNNIGRTPPLPPLKANIYWSLLAGQGAKGDRGEKGDTGAALSVIDKLTDESQLPLKGEPGDAYSVNGFLYVWSEALQSWENLGNIKGEKGDKGDKGEEGESAYQVALANGFVGTSEEWLASLKGEKGDAPDLTEINEKVDGVEKEVTEHLAQKLFSEDGVHGIRYYGDSLSIEDDEGNWHKVSTGDVYQNNIERVDKANAIGNEVKALTEDATAIGNKSFAQYSTFAIVTTYQPVTKTVSVADASSISPGSVVRFWSNSGQVGEVSKEYKVKEVKGLDIIIDTTEELPTALKYVLTKIDVYGTTTAIGNRATSIGSASQALGYRTLALGFASTATGHNTEATANSAFSSGYMTKATHSMAHAEGDSTLASGRASHTEGEKTVAEGDSSHAEGKGSKATGSASHAEGLYTVSSGTSSHAEGNYTEATASYAHSEGDSTKANRQASHAEGGYTRADGIYSHAEGIYTKATGSASHAGGNNSLAESDYSTAIGNGTQSNSIGGLATGRYNRKMSGTQNAAFADDDAFVIGNGTSAAALSNAFRVTFDGKAYGQSAYNSTGADYAEYFEWLDKNPRNQDRVGFVVTLDKGKIRKATSKDEYILGIISANPSVIGNSYQDTWNGMYVTDEWGRIQYHFEDVEYTEFIKVEQEDGTVTEVPTTKTRKEYQAVLNPNWNPDLEYVPREERAEWDAVGITGQLLVRDDGTLFPNNFARVGNLDGEITLSEEPTNMRVMERVAKNIVRVFIK